MEGSTGFSSTTVDSVSTVVSGGLESVLIISARVDSCERELSLAGLVGELTGEIWTEIWGPEELDAGVGEAWGILDDL